MSMKVYNGYVIKQMSAEGLRHFNLKLKAALEAHLKILVYKKSGEMAAEILQQIKDDATFEERLPTWFQYDLLEYMTKHSTQRYAIGRKRSIINSIGLILDTCGKQIKDTQQRNPPFDFGFSISYFPMRNKILALLFCENPELTKTFESFKQVGYYGYWDNVDKPKEVSAKDWRKRRKEWDTVLGGNGWGTPAAYGLNTDLLDGKRIFNTGNDDSDKLIQNVIRFVPSYKQRLKEYVYTKARELQVNERLKDRKDKEISEYVRADMDAVKFLKTPDGKKYLLQIKKEYGKRVIKNISEKDLKTEILFGKK